MSYSIGKYDRWIRGCIGRWMDEQSKWVNNLTQAMQFFPELWYAFFNALPVCLIPHSALTSFSVPGPLTAYLCCHQLWHPAWHNAATPAKWVQQAVRGRIVHDNECVGMGEKLWQDNQQVPLLFWMLWVPYPSYHPQWKAQRPVTCCHSKNTILPVQSQWVEMCVISGVRGWWAPGSQAFLVTLPMDIVMAA